MTISKQFELSTGHRLSNYKGKCRHLHGHNYIGKLVIEGAMLDDIGFLMDYGDLKQLIKDTFDLRFDHKMILKKGDLFNEAIGKVCNDFGDTSIVWVDYNPTVENIIIDMQEMIENKLMTNLKYDNLKVHIELSETSTSFAYI